MGWFAGTLVATSLAQAAPVIVPISDLYNTGMSTPWNAGTQTPIAGTDPKLQGTPVVGDPHWTVAYDPPGPTPLGPYAGTKLLDDRNDSNTANVNPFTGNQFTRFQLDLAHDTQRQDTHLDNSQWIKTLSAGVSADPPGVYVFQTTFTTTQAITSLSISGYFKAADVLGIQLNGGAIIDPGSPHGSPSEPTPSTPSRPFTITGTGGLTNTLRFYVNRPGTGLAALRVQFSNATFTVPEPSTLALGALGLVGFGVSRLRRRWFDKSSSN
jgi:hypothetical protein